MLKSAEAARREWERLSAPWPDAREQPRRLLLRHVRGENRQVAVDPLLMHAMTWPIDDDDVADR